MSVSIADASALPMSITEIALSAASEADFEVLYEATARPLLNYLRCVTGRRDLAEDLLQDTFCRFLVRRPAPMPLEETRRYLFRIATNLLRDRWRRNDGESTPEAPESAVTPDLDAQLDIHRLLASLKPRERELLWLAYVEGLSHAEIAEVTGLTPLSIRLLLFRARKHAAHLLQPSPVTV